MDSVYLTIAYCPTPFTGAGAVVQASAATGNFSIESRFTLPGSEIGCPMNTDITFLSDPQRRPHRAAALRGRLSHMSDTTDFGRLSLIDLDTGKIAHTAEGSSATGDLFDGFISFAINDESGVANVGLSGHVTESGFCHNGCYRLGTQDLMSGTFTGLPALPFKSTMTSVSFHDYKSRTYYAQGSYTLTADAACADDVTKQCLFAINSTTGALLSSKPFDEFTVYRYADGPISSDGTVLAWGFGFQDTCGETLQSYAFARVDLSNGAAKLVACIEQTEASKVHKSPEMAAFSPDQKRLAFATGDAIETGLRQLLVFEVATGKLLLSSKLEGLPTALGVSATTPNFAVWALAHMEAA